MFLVLPCRFRYLCADEVASGAVVVTSGAVADTSGAVAVTFVHFRFSSALSIPSVWFGVTSV